MMIFFDSDKKCLLAAKVNFYLAVSINYAGAHFLQINVESLDCHTSALKVVVFDVELRMPFFILQNTDFSWYVILMHVSYNASVSMLKF